MQTQTQRPLSRAIPAGACASGGPLFPDAGFLPSPQGTHYIQKDAWHIECVRSFFKESKNTNARSTPLQDSVLSTAPLS